MRETFGHRLRTAFTAKAAHAVPEGDDEPASASWPELLASPGGSTPGDAERHETPAVPNPVPPGPRRGLSRLRLLLAAAAVVVVAAGVVALRERQPGPDASVTAAESSASPTVSGSQAISASASAVPSTGTAGPTPAVPVLLPNGAEAARDAIPWALVGGGWTVALWSAAAASPPGQGPVGDGSPATLYLVNPLGGRYAIQTYPAEAVPYRIIDWSGDGRRVLFQSLSTLQVTEIDISTGASHTFAAKTPVARYTLPEGRAILMRPAEGSGAFYRVGLDGTRQQTYPSEDAAAGSLRDPIFTSDGAQLVFGADHGLAVVGNGGSIVRDLPGTTSVGGCTPTRMWTDAQVLARCQSTGTTALWLFPIAGGAPSELARPGGGGISESDAWTIGDRTYTQSGGGCGYAFLSSVGPDRQTSMVPVPGVMDGRSVVVLGAYGSTLIVQTTFACGGGLSLAAFDPTANAVTELLGPGVNDGSVIDAMLDEADR